MTDPRALAPSDARPVALLAAQRIVRRDAARDQTLLQPTDFSLDAGERIALTGPSGSGKSVLLRALSLLDPLDGGDVYWRGRPVTRARIPAFRRHVAYLRQRAALLDGSVEDNLRYYALQRARMQAAGRTGASAKPHAPAAAIAAPHAQAGATVDECACEPTLR